MVVAAQSQGISRDELRRLPITTQQQYSLRAAQSIASKKGVMLLDTHSFVKIPHQGRLPGLPKEILDILKPVAIVSIDSKPECILQRRETDQSRVREPGTVKEIKRDIKWHKRFLAAYAMYSASMIIKIDNNLSADNSAQDLSRRIARWNTEWQIQLTSL